MLALIAAAGLAVTVPPPRPPHSGRDVLRAMHERWAGHWYGTLEFMQDNTAPQPDGSARHSTWHEIAAFPGRLRIDFVAPDSNRTILFRADSEYVFTRDSLVRAAAFVHPLLVLGFDVYFQDPAAVAAKLERLGFDLSRVHEDVWHGRPVWVVGARAGDFHRKQFWVDRDRLVFVRLLQPDAQDSTRTDDTRFEAYQPLAGAWVSARVEFLEGGSPVWIEQYRDIRAGVPAPDSLFVPPR